jgi:hypothetical protein
MGDAQRLLGRLTGLRNVTGIVPLVALLLRLTPVRLTIRPVLLPGG